MSTYSWRSNQVDIWFLSLCILHIPNTDRKSEETSDPTLHAHGCPTILSFAFKVTFLKSILRKSPRKTKLYSKMWNINTNCSAKNWNYLTRKVEKGAVVSVRLLPKILPHAWTEQSPLSLVRLDREREKSRSHNALQRWGRWEELNKMRGYRLVVHVSTIPCVCVCVKEWRGLERACFPYTSPMRGSLDPNTCCLQWYVCKSSHSRLYTKLKVEGCFNFNYFPDL